MPTPRDSFREIVALAPDDFEKSLRLALSSWMLIPGIDGDVNMESIFSLRLFVDGRVIHWNGSFAVLMRLIQVIQMTINDKARRCFPEIGVGPH